MNIKMADFLFEDVGENENDSNKNKQDEKNSQPEQQDDEGRKQIRSKLDDADLFSDVELNYAEVKKLCANLATIVTSADKNIIRLTKAFESIKSKDVAELSDEEKKDVEELKEIESKPLGLITPQLLTTLFKKNLSAGFSGKIGKIHLNPFQMIIGKDQVEGATAQDFAAYEKEGAVFAMLSDENSKVVNCNGKAIVIMIPALMANVSDHLDVYSITYPEVTKDSPVIRSVSQLFFTLLTKDDIKSLQTDPKKIRSFVAREKKQENLVYKLGLSSILLEDAGISQQTPALSQGEENSDETGESGESEEKTGNKETDSDNNSITQEKVKATFNTNIAPQKTILNNITATNLDDLGDKQQSKIIASSVASNISSFFKDHIENDNFTKMILASMSENGQERILAEFLYYYYLENGGAYDLKSLDELGKYLSLENDDRVPKLSDKQINKLKKNLIRNAAISVVNAVKQNNPLPEPVNSNTLIDQIDLTALDKYIESSEALSDDDVKDIIVDSILKEGETSPVIEKFATMMASYFNAIGKDGGASKVLRYKLVSEQIESPKEATLYILESLYKSNRVWKRGIAFSVSKFLKEVIEKSINEGSDRVKSFWASFDKKKNRFFDKNDITELALRWYFNPEWGNDQIEKLFESKNSLKNILLEIDESDVGKNDVGIDVDKIGLEARLFDRLWGWFEKNISAKSLHEVLKEMIQSEDFSPPDFDNISLLSKVKSKEDKQQKSNKEKYIERAANNGKDQLLTSILNKVKTSALEVIKSSLGVGNDKFNDFIDNTLGGYFDKAIKKELKYIIKPENIINVIEGANNNKIKTIYSDDNPVHTYEDGKGFFVNEDNIDVTELKSYLKKTKDFKENTFDEAIKKIHVTLLLSDCLNQNTGAYFSELFYRIFSKEEYNGDDTSNFNFDADKFSKFITSESLLKSLLKGSIRDFESSVLVSDETATTLRDKYIASQGQDEWEKFVIYAYFNEPKNLTDLLKENKTSQKSLLAKALYEDNMFAAEMLLSEMEFLKKAKDKISKFGRETFSGVSDNQKAYLADTITKLSSGNELTPPKGWKSTIEKAEEEGLDKDQLSQLKSARIKQNCKLIIDSSYSMLIRDEWKEYSKSEEARKDSKRAGRESAYDKSGDKIKTMTEIGSAAAVIGVGALGMAALPWALGAFIFSNEIGNIGGGVASTILKGVDRGFGFAKSKISGKPSVQEKLDALEYDVSLKEETAALFAVIKDITEEHVFEGKHIYDKFSSLSFLLEETGDQTSEEGSSEESESSSKKQELREISEEDVMQYLIERDVKLFSSDFDSDKAYNRFFIRLNAILKKFANIKITGIKDKSVTKEMAKEHVAETTNANAKVGQPASNLIDIFSRQMAMSDQPPVAALASAINDINHSGGGVASLLVYMMLTNPQGFGSLVQTFNGDANNAINQVTDLMAQAGETPQEEVVEQVQVGISEKSKPKISKDQWDKLLKFVDALVQQNDLQINIDTGNFAALISVDRNGTDREEDSDGKIKTVLPFEIVEEDLESFNQDTYNLIMSLCFNDPTRTLDFDKMHLTKTGGDEHWKQEDLYYFYDTFITQFGIAQALGLKNDNMLDVMFNKNNYSNIDKLKEVFCLDVFYNKTAGHLDSDRIFPGDDELQDFKVRLATSEDFFYKVFKEEGLLESRKFRSKNVLSEEYVLGDLSSLLFENVVDKKRKNIVKKEDKIDLQKEWRNLWDI